LHLALFVVVHLEIKFEVGCGHHASGVLRPFAQLQAWAGKDVPKASIFPFAWVAEAVEVKVPHLTRRHGVGLDHGVGGTFDAARHTQCVQQVAYEGRFARAQIAMQSDASAQVGACQRGGQLRGIRSGGGFIGPNQSFYNGQIIQRCLLSINYQLLLTQIQALGQTLGFSQIAVAPLDLSSAEPHLQHWLAQNFHGSMDYMARHGMKRARPAELVPGTLSVLTARMNYLPRDTTEGWQEVEWQRLRTPTEAVVSTYARGRDYHKVLRNRLDTLAQQIDALLVDTLKPNGFDYRAFTDSAPVMEAELATRSGQGWRGKHSLVLNREAGSMFFLGEIFLNVALPPSDATSAHCGQCTACMDVCPTQAIVAEGLVDARRCISYLTIEHEGAIDEALRPLMGNHIYGCDDCQLVCPWNKFAQTSTLPDFDVRAGLVGQDIARLLAWTEEEFLRYTEGSPIRRIGHERWLRNLAVAGGNALRQAKSVAFDRGVLQQALKTRLTHPSNVVREHVQWALVQSTFEVV
jgi:epoxyqueuosine reductase